MAHLLISDRLAYAVGWALVHFIWQGAVILAAVSVVLAGLRNSSARVHYGVTCLGLLIMFLLPVATAVRNLQTNAERNASLQRTAELDSSLESPAPAATLRPVASPKWAIDVESWLPSAVFFWLVGVIVLFLRALSQWLGVQRLRRHGSAVSKEVAALTRALALRLGLDRPVRILESALVTVPTVIGAIRPLILWPAGALSGLSPEQVEAVIAHELAHIRRLDYFVNMLQTAVETLFFYHPAVWLISRRIRIERENCCDDLVVAICGDPVVYVKALVSLEEMRSAKMALAVRADGGALLDRVRRLLGANTQRERHYAISVAGAVITLLMALAVSAPDVTLGSKARERSTALPQLPVLGTAPRPAAPVASPTAPLREKKYSEQVMSWSNLGARSQIRYEGTFTLADDESDIVQMSPDAYFFFSETPQFFGVERTIELRGRADGKIDRRYTSGGRDQAYEPAGRVWFSESLLRLARRTGFAAEARIARALKRSGPEGALSEAARAPTDFVRRVSFKAFFEEAKPVGRLFEQSVDQAARDISSDYELAELLMGVGASRPLDDSEWDAYFQALKSIGSDFEHRRVLTALAGGDLSIDALARVVRSSREISSSFERASFLVTVAEKRKLEGDLRDAYLEAANPISSKLERSRALDALARN